MEREPGHLALDPHKAVEDLTWYKVVGIGHTGVGKTCLIKHFCESKFTAGYQPTVGVDYGFKIHNVNDTDVRVHLWDLSGGSEYLDVRNELYTGTDAVFLVYDVTNQASYDGLDSWMREMTKYGSGGPEICLVANKCDLKQQRVVSMPEGRRYASNNKLMYHETSCLNGDGIQKMFSELLEAVAKKRESSKS